jgi:hypothetical protein
MDTLISGLVALLLLSLLICGYVFVRGVVERRGGAVSAAAVRWSLTQPGPLAQLPGSRAIPVEVAAYHQFYVRVFARVRHAEMRRSRQWPYWRLSWYAPVGAIVGVLMLFLVHADSDWQEPVGLKVRLLRPGIEGERSPGIEPVRIDVSCEKFNQQPVVVVNSQAASWEELEGVLRRELRLRPPDWPIYVQGDRNMEWGCVVRTIDVIHGLHAQVVLLTNKY